MRLLTKNVGTMYLNDGSLLSQIVDFLPPTNGKLSDGNFERLIRKLKAEDTDVILLQEVREKHVGTLERVLDGYQHIPGGQTKGEFRYTLVQRLPVSASEMIVTTYRGKQYPSAIATTINDVCVVNVHFSHHNHRLRLQELHDVMDYVHDQDAWGIIAGDFNMRRRPVRLLARRVNKAMRALVEGRGYRDVSRDAGPTYYFGMKLDYVYTNLPYHPLERGVVRRDLKVSVFEDHYAVLARLPVVR